MSKPRKNLARVDRRTTIKWLAATMAAASAGCTAGQRSVGEEIPPQPAGPLLGVAEAIDGVTIGTDPDLMNPLIPWTRTMTEAQLDVATRLCDLILPADDRSPAASALGVPDFIDEWVSAPYAAQQRDREQILPGLEWLERQSLASYGDSFTRVSADQARDLLDRIAWPQKLAPGLEEQGRFFDRFRSVAVGAYYTTAVGMEDIGYLGNVPISGDYPGPSEEALAHLDGVLAALGLSQPN